MKKSIIELAKLPVFPYAEEFPMLTDEELMELAQDLEVNGQQHPIILFRNAEGETVVLDGRNRLSAFSKTNLSEADVEYYDGTEFQAVEKVRALNILRRHLTVGQRAMAAQAYLPYEEEEAKKRQLAALKQNTVQPDQAEREEEGTTKKGQSRDIVAEKFNLSGQRISEAKKLILNAPDLAERVKSDDISLDRATKELKARNEAKDKKIHQVESGAPDLFIKLQRGDVTLDDAYVQLVNREAEKKRDAQAKSKALFEFNNFATYVSTRTKDLNLLITKLTTLDDVEQALGHLKNLEVSINLTRESLKKHQINLEAAEDGRVGG